jgi:hypothetical protein
VKSASLIAFVVGILAVACEPSPDVQLTQRGGEYFPLEVGSFSIYDVDSTSIRFNVETSYSFQVRMVVSASYENSAGGTSYVLRREKRDDPSQAWKAAGTWSAWKDDRNAVLAEGNVRYIRLQFPINAGNEWNGNAMNSMGGDDFCDDALCDRYSVSEVDPDVVVVQSDETDVLVKYDVRSETYRKDVGLVDKQMTVLEYCTAQDCFGKQFVNNGLRYTQTLIEHGQI